MDRGGTQGALVAEAMLPAETSADWLAELERLLATRDAELSTLDSEIRRLFDSEGDELWQDILLLLNRQARVSDAAIYKLSPDGQTLVRKGLLGSARSLGERLALRDVEMADLALKSKSAVTIPEFWQRAVGEQRDYLMVVPLLDSRDHPLAVLIVTGMPFISLTKKSVYLVALICRWASRVAEVDAQADTTSRVVEGVEGHQGVEREGGVVEIAASATVDESAAGCGGGAHEPDDEAAHAVAAICEAVTAGKRAKPAGHP